MNDGEVEGGGAKVSEEDKENRAGGGRGGSHLSLATPVCCTLREYRAFSMQRGAARCFTVKQRRGGVGGERRV